MKGLSGVGQHEGRWKEDQVRAFHPAEFCLPSIVVEGRPSEGASMST